MFSGEDCTNLQCTIAVNLTQRYKSTSALVKKYIPKKNFISITVE